MARMEEMPANSRKSVWVSKSVSNSVPTKAAGAYYLIRDFVLHTNTRACQLSGLLLQ
jgi:hypothetical protein